MHRLRHFISSKEFRSLSLFSLSYADLTGSFKESLNHLNISHVCYMLHSLRHENATFEWPKKLPLDDVLLKGKWESDKYCKRYLKDFKELLV